MKNFLTATFLISTLSMAGAHAMVLSAAHSDHANSKRCSEYSVGKVVVCGENAFEWLTSFPTLLVLADEKEMGSAELTELLKAEAQNRVDGIEGDYLLLNKIAKDQNLTVDQVADEVLK